MKTIKIITLFIVLMTLQVPLLSKENSFDNIAGMAKYSTGYGIFYERFLLNSVSLIGSLDYWYENEKEGSFSILGNYYPIGTVVRPLIGIGLYGSYAISQEEEIGFHDGTSGGIKLSLGGVYFPAAENIQIKLFGNVHIQSIFSGSTSIYFTPGLSLGYRF